jgi:hypothetical protein
MAICIGADSEGPMPRHARPWPMSYSRRADDNLDEPCYPNIMVMLHTIEYLRYRRMYMLIWIPMVSTIKGPSKHLID